MRPSGNTSVPSLPQRAEMIREFKGSGEHDAFQRWRNGNARGVFLTVKSPKKANLHGSNCPHLPLDWYYTAGGASATTKRKVCGGSQSELLDWARAEGMTVGKCGDCMRQDFIE